MCICEDEVWNICLLRISQVINIKHGEQSRELPQCRRRRRLPLTCSSHKITEMRNYITAIVPLRSLDGWTHRQKVQSRQRLTKLFDKLQRFCVSHRCWRFSRRFINKIDWLLLHRVLSPIETLGLHFPHFLTFQANKITFARDILASNRESHDAIFSFLFLDGEGFFVVSRTALS